MQCHCLYFAKNEGQFLNMMPLIGLGHSASSKSIEISGHVSSRIYHEGTGKGKND
jgi:hypothetical protein